MKLCVVGGMNLDVTGTVSSLPVMGDSNPGAIRFSPGGVGRNIACRIAAAGHDALLLTALTSDLAGSMLRADCAAQGLSALSCAQLGLQMAEELLSARERGEA